jgi:hypothetical protein
MHSHLCLPSSFVRTRRVCTRQSQSTFASAIARHLEHLFVYLHTEIHTHTHDVNCECPIDRSYLYDKVNTTRNTLFFLAHRCESLSHRHRIDSVGLVVEGARRAIARTTTQSRATRSNVIVITKTPRTHPSQWHVDKLIFMMLTGEWFQVGLFLIKL